ncbi:hypothetical protein Tsubulata_026195 [Turnera subulata]|uniref:Protein kinase domain-containing protein n=1 Tax=Turnera subulata TaxID=218843 RepID=A0A9Q0FJN9_9ROSI|nr:hypothetical protein Tsubulata_026195 [Turnera subulata]
MDKNLGKAAVDRHQLHHTNVESRNEALGSVNPRFFNDPSANLSTNIRPPDYNMSAGARPVLNYSIQTGEEFALEFMRERVNPRQQLFPNSYADPSATPAYMDLKGILGISHTGSETGSDISRINAAAEKAPAHEFERKALSTREDRRYYDSVQPAPQTSSKKDTNLGFSSSQASDSSPLKIKFLCSFGGTILPRPSDGKLRYVGGETRIIRLSKNISWQEFMHKTLAVFSQAHTIKYQLPGEDLDALVSVSCDEDLQNMMEECSVLDDGGLQKPRMFLFSSDELEDAQFGLGSIECDSEIQYVVAVNGMDLGSRKNSINLARSSGNNLDELLSLNVERESGQAVVGLSSGSTAPMPVNVNSSTTQSSLPIPESSSRAVDSNSQPYQGQKMYHGDSIQHPGSSMHTVDSFPKVEGKSTNPLSVQMQYGYVSQPSNHAAPAETLMSMPLHVDPTQQGVFVDEPAHGGFHMQNSEVLAKEAKLKRDSSSQKINEPEKTQSLDQEDPVKELNMKRDGSLQKVNEAAKSWALEHENVSSLHTYDGSIQNPTSRDEVLPFANSAAELTPPVFPNQIKKRPEEPLHNLMHAEAATGNRKNGEDVLLHSSGGPFAPGYGGSEVDPTDFSYLESSVVPQRVFHSERIPREQAELNRLSKSDDSFDPQVLITQARSGCFKKVSESANQLEERNLDSQSEQSFSSAKPSSSVPQTVEDALTQFEKYKDFADNMSKWNSNISQGHEANLQKSEPKQLVFTSVDDHDIGWGKDSNSDISINDQDALRMMRPAASKGTYYKHPEGSAFVRSEFEQTETTGGKNHGNNRLESAQSLALTENPLTAVSQGNSTFGSGTAVQGDISIDINDRFPRDILSDLFSKARIHENPSGISPMLVNGTGLSLNMENHEPKRWSYFRNLAQDQFVRKDVSLIDQDHLGFTSSDTNHEGGRPTDYSYPPLNSDAVASSHVDTNYEDIHRDTSGMNGPITMDLRDGHSQLKGSDSAQFDAVNPRIQESEYEDGKVDINFGAPLVDLSLGDFDITTLQIIKNEDLEELRELGSGTFGTVYHGKWRGTDVAIKRIKKSCFAGRSSEQERLTLEFWREAEILSKLHHPNVVAFYGVVQDGPGGTLATVAEFMVNGSLRHVLLSKDRHLDRRKKLFIAMDAAFGMEYLHSKNIVHFDLKCDNLLVNLKDPLRPICKVGDFGLSKIKRNTLVTGGVRGTLPWMAPELLNGSSSKVSEKVDVFSFGIVLWEILTGEEPYANMHYGAIIGGIVNNTLRPPVPSFCDPEWKLLMEQCWAPDPVARPSFTEIARRLRSMSAACQTKPQGHQHNQQMPK